MLAEHPNTQTLIDGLLRQIRQSDCLQVSDEEMIEILEGWKRDCPESFQPEPPEIALKEWHRLKPAIEQEWAEKAKQHYRKAIREWVISNWVKQNTSAREYALKSMCIMTEIYLKEEREVELRAYLTDVIEVGKDAADKRLERKNSLRGFLADLSGTDWLRLICEISYKLAYVVLAMWLFAAASSRFERVALALLLMTYNYLLFGRTWDVLNRMFLQDAEYERFREIRRVLKVPETELERHWRIAHIFTVNDDKTKKGISVGLTMLSSLIVWGIGIWNLVLAIW
jgi:hypothetical protein